MNHDLFAKLAEKYPFITFCVYANTALGGRGPLTDLGPNPSLHLPLNSREHILLWSRDTFLCGHVTLPLLSRDTFLCCHGPFSFLRHVPLPRLKIEFTPELL